MVKQAFDLDHGLFLETPGRLVYPNPQSQAFIEEKYSKARGGSSGGSGGGGEGESWTKHQNAITGIKVYARQAGERLRA